MVVVELATARLTEAAVAALTETTLMGEAELTGRKLMKAGPKGAKLIEAETRVALKNDWGDALAEEEPAGVVMPMKTKPVGVMSKAAEVRTMEVEATEAKPRRRRCRWRQRWPS